jgi:hypothetical protein
MVLLEVTSEACWVAMLTLLIIIIILAIGGTLATVVSAIHFAFGVLVLTCVGFAYEIYLRIPLGQAALGAVAGFVCAQFGYVAGVGVRAVWVAKIGRAQTDAEILSKTSPHTGKIPPSAG